MTQAAFYAPMKSPTHPVPSGDRAMARALMQALRGTGATVTLASTLRLHEPEGNATRQAKLRRDADEEVGRLIRQGRSAGWAVWVTYHCYYKAPDLIGPAVAAALDIPYVLIEATRARKRLSGPWADFARASEDACDAAAAILYLTRRDADALKAYGPGGQWLGHLRPFLSLRDVPEPSSLEGPMLSVGMMRARDKRASYALIAKALAQLQTRDWTLEIAGDGPERQAVEDMFAPFGPRVSFLGAVDSDALEAAYGYAGLLLWPGVNEAFGMTYLEAQAAGVPVVAQHRPGVCDVLAPGHYPKPASGAQGLARRIDALLGDDAMRADAGAQAADYVARHHLLPGAEATLTATLKAVMA